MSVIVHALLKQAVTGGFASVCLAEFAEGAEIGLGEDLCDRLAVVDPYDLCLVAVAGEDEVVLIGDGVAVHLLELILKAVNGCKLRVFEGVGGILIYLHKARLVGEHADYLIEVFELLGILLIGVVDKGTDGVLVHKVGVVCLSASVVCGMGSFKEDLFVKT